MLTIEGTYLKSGQVSIRETVKVDHPVKILITFLEEIKIPKTKLSQRFSFKKSRELFKGCTGSLSEAIIEERRSRL